jgi:hypothetical protein
MLSKVKPYNVSNGQRVTLRKALPTDRMFGNTHSIPEDARGTITSEGFVAGKLQVEFYTHAYGTQKVAFNELSAAEYLVTDIY